MLKSKGSGQGLSGNLKRNTGSHNPQERTGLHLKREGISVDGKALIDGFASGIEKQAISSGCTDVRHVDVELTIKLSGQTVGQHQKITAGIGQGKKVVGAIREDRGEIGKTKVEGVFCSAITIQGHPAQGEICGDRLIKGGDGKIVACNVIKGLTGS